LRRSIQRELNDFFGLLDNAAYSIQKVTKSAFSQARSKLKPEAFIELSQSSVDFFMTILPIFYGTNIGYWLVMEALLGCQTAKI
jgi:hypothetical protein